MRGPIKRWIGIRDEIQSEFSDLMGYERLQRALEREAARRREYAREYWRMRRRMGWRPSRATVERARIKRRARRTRQRLSQRAPITCANPRCGSVFVPYYSTTRYCTRVCMHRASQNRAHRVKRARTAAERRVLCLTCGVVFEKHKSDRMYCSRRCKELKQYFRVHGRWPRTFAPKRGDGQRAA